VASGGLPHHKEHIRWIQNCVNNTASIGLNVCDVIGEKLINVTWYKVVTDCLE